MVANLPYNVATPVVLHLLETQPLITRLLVMVQKEAGERLAAHAGDEAYGAVSLRVQYFADAKIVGQGAAQRLCAQAQRRLGPGVAGAPRPRAGGSGARQRRGALCQ